MSIKDERRVLLVVLDGAGISDDVPGNAVNLRTLPWLFECMREHGYAVLDSAGEAVGLEPGQVGNSESGHLTLGAGYVVPCMSRRIATSFEDGTWAADPAWAAVDSPLHVVGMLSDAGVHALSRTLIQAVRAALAGGVESVVVHPVLDGVDSKAGTAPRLLDELFEALAGEPRARLGIVQGRAAFCDRSGDARISEGFVAALAGDPPAFDAAELAAHLLHASEATFPARRLGPGRALAPGDTVLHTSHRADRARQVIRALTERHQVLTVVDSGVEDGVSHVFFRQAPTDRGLFAEFLRAGLQSRRIAEKCKFPHVTHFFNGFDSGREGEPVCIPSIPEAEIRSNPAMSVDAVTDEIVRALEDGAEHVVIANLANLDQVGHLGDYGLAEAAARAVERSLCRIAAAAARNGWTIIVTSDHGNADCVVDPTGRPHGSHTHAPVPLVVVPAPGRRFEWAANRGSLASVASAVLAALDLPSPAWMEPALGRFVEAR